ncbi:MAG: hypothetical protein K0S40_298 [Actinomycetospora sp.]|nr:hypothetical protein [Actinomycetospora sp.]
MTRTGAEGTPPPHPRRRSIFRVDPPEPELSDASVRGDELPRASAPAEPVPVPADGPQGVRPTPRAHRSIFRPEAEHLDGAER